jgi:putative transposase
MRFRLYPSDTQKVLLLEQCGHARYVWNLGLEQPLMWRRWKGPTPGLGAQGAQLTAARTAAPWLACGSQTVQQQALRDLDQAWRNVFAGTHKRPTWQPKREPDPNTRRARSVAGNLHVHLVFAAKYRPGVFNTQMLNLCEHVMAQVCPDFGATPAEFNGEQDHVHLLAAYPPKVALSHLVNSLKGVSSRRLRQDFVGRINKAAMHRRSWPPSYLARSCGGPPLSTVQDHITNQKRPDQARIPPCPQGQGFHPRSPMIATPAGARMRWPSTAPTRRRTGTPYPPLPRRGGSVSSGSAPW